MTENGINMDKKEYERIQRVLGKKVQFIEGDLASAYGALLAGCRYFAGYPITPATETAEIMSQLMPKVGGCAIQMEDEIASIGAIIGASWAGVKSMTTTSGPGFSLMQENIGYACMTETPCVVVNVQRSGPSTGQPTEGAQGDMMQARWGTHGDHEIIALCPNSVQECMMLTLEAFNLSEYYRNPAIVLMDGEVGHMREQITIPDYKDITIIERKLPTVGKEDYVPFINDKSKIPEMAVFGTGYHTYVTGLTHHEDGLPATDDQSVHHALVKRLNDKIAGDREKLIKIENKYVKNAKIGIVSFGITSRAALHAAATLNRKGIKTNYLRLISIWPFPQSVIADLAKKVDIIFVPELNLGQIYHKVVEFANGKCKVVSLPKTGGEMHSPQEIVSEISNTVKK
jgi:2-oxoglutarate ferredoxin oxidoreductase subunit alpha